MSESVEQAARARGFEERCMGILERCVQAVELLDRLDDRRGREIAQLQAELGEVRDGMLALSNRIEAVTREAAPQLGFTQRMDPV